MGISESRARARLNDPGGSRLAEPDGYDPDGKPYWFASTIDAWCRRTGRPVPHDARWLWRWPDADKPVPVIRSEVVDVPGATGIQAYVIVWDRPEGHVVYVTTLGEHGTGT